MCPINYGWICFKKSVLYTSVLQLFWHYGSVSWKTGFPGVGWGFQDDSSALHFFCTSSVLLLHQLHFRSQTLDPEGLEFLLYSLPAKKQYWRVHISALCFSQNIHNSEHHRQPEVNQLGNRERCEWNISLLIRCESSREMWQARVQLPDQKLHIDSLLIHSVDSSLVFNPTLSPSLRRS